MSKKRFKWTGLTYQGYEQKGFIEAPSLKEAKRQLQNQTILVQKIRPKRQLVPCFNPKIRSSDFLMFCKQLTSLTKANIPIAQSLSILSQNKLPKILKTVINDLKKDIETGLSFAVALKNQGPYFHASIWHLVEIGERSGRLPHILEMIALYQERNHILKQNVKKALSYPLLIMITAVLVTFGLLFFIIPQFQALFKSFHTDLPLLTRGLIFSASLFREFFWVLGGAFSLFIGVFFYFRKKNARLAVFVDKCLLKMPIVGSILTKTAIMRFSSILNLSLTAGLPLIEGLKTITGSVTNRCYMTASKQIIEGILTGEPLHTAMHNTGLFPSMVTELVALGERTGALSPMLINIYTDYEQRLDEAIDRITRTVEPLLLLGLGLFIGLLLIALYVPIFNLGSVL